jgi:hypothetical protein
MKHGEREVTEHSSCAFDLSKFHPDPQCVCRIIPASGHTHGLIYCETCKVAVDVEAFGIRIVVPASGWSTPEEKERKG